MLENAVALIAPFVAMFLAAPDRGIQAIGWTVLVVSLPILSLSWSATVLDESELRSGLRYRPLRIPRAAIVQATVGKVGWGQGFVKGIELDLVGGRKQRLSLSANLLRERREKWIVSINQWADDDEPAVDIFGTPHALVLSPKRQTEVLAYLANHPDGGNVVLVAEFDKGTPRLDHGWTTRTAAAGNESVELTYPGTTIGSLSLEPALPTTITITGARQHVLAEVELTLEADDRVLMVLWSNRVEVSELVNSALSPAICQVPLRETFFKAI